jgi:hypothetical protein
VVEGARGTAGPGSLGLGAVGAGAASEDGDKGDEGGLSIGGKKPAAAAKPGAPKPATKPKR